VACSAFITLILSFGTFPPSPLFTRLGFGLPGRRRFHKVPTRFPQDRPEVPTSSDKIQTLSQLCSKFFAMIF
jgi:hypothetical protein